MEPATTAPRLRIGELSRRVGLSDHVLRAWETRYSLFQPTRSPGGFRLYSADDEARARHMVDLLAEGMSAAEAAALVLSSPLTAASHAEPDAPPRTGRTEGGQSPSTRPSSATIPTATALLEALAAFDEAAAHAVLDRLLDARSVASALSDVVLPSLAELGRRWEVGEASVAQEHFASNVIRGRLVGLARGWGIGRGPRAILACAPGEHHDLPLLAFGIVLHHYGWRISFLGADTPFADIALAVDSLPGALVVLSATVSDSLSWPHRDLVVLAARTQVALAGPAATADMAASIGAMHLSGDPVTAALLLDQQLGGQTPTATPPTARTEA